MEQDRQEDDFSPSHHQLMKDVDDACFGNEENPEDFNLLLNDQPSSEDDSDDEAYEQIW